MPSTSDVNLFQSHLSQSGLQPEKGQWLSPKVNWCASALCELWPYIVIITLAAWSWWPLRSSSTLSRSWPSPMKWFLSTKVSATPLYEMNLAKNKNCCQTTRKPEDLGKWPPQKSEWKFSSQQTDFVSLVFQHSFLLSESLGKTQLDIVRSCWGL